MEEFYNQRRCVKFTIFAAYFDLSTEKGFELPILLTSIFFSHFQNLCNVWFLDTFQIHNSVSAFIEDNKKQSKLNVPFCIFEIYFAEALNEINIFNFFWHSLIDRKSVFWITYEYF